ncbi:hypothetical protein Fuma_05397 [Fuerstiella marisgermanici]|uniref:Tetratricopeptide repeat protein n=2 Tax=Fuerstiella marisgermanici TaxID=1891926 RepID=A0A1P8WNV9_9PLAN|nr:hypothetical protein Fuma_05397 [Fuerstiella marisgermanici]
MHAAEFHREQSSACYEAAIEAAEQLTGSHVAGQIELARAHLNSGYRPPNLNRGESLTADQRVADLSHVDRAIDILQSLKDAQQQSTTTNILHARSLLARSRISSKPRDKHDDVRDAVSILRSQLDATPDDTNVRFELVATLADVNVRGLRSRARLNDASRRLREALDEISKLRSSNPDNEVFLTNEVHLRHKVSAVLRTRSRSRFDDADAVLSEAIQLQTTLIQKWPDSVPHRCWRAMLYRSQAELYRQWGRADASKDAITNAKADIDAVESESADHPMVKRTRDAVNGLGNAPTSSP